MEADPAITRELMEHLVAAFEAFADRMADRNPDGLRYIDSLMGCHNFYKAVILDLERRSGLPVRDFAIETLTEAFRRVPRP